MVVSLLQAADEVQVHNLILLDEQHPVFHSFMSCQPLQDCSGKVLFCQSWSRRRRDPTASHLPGLSSAQWRLQPLSDCYQKKPDSSSLKHKILQLPGGSDSLEMLHFHCFVLTNTLCFQVEYSVFEMTPITTELDFTKLPCSLPSSFCSGQCL